MIMAKALQVAAETIQRHEQKLLQAETIIDEQYAQLEEIYFPKTADISKSFANFAVFKKCGGDFNSPQA